MHVSDARVQVIPHACDFAGIALLSGSFEADLKKEKEQHAKTKQRLEVAETAACDLTDKALMASNIEEELRKEKEEHAKTKQSLELAQTPTHTLSEEHMCNISQVRLMRVCNIAVAADTVCLGPRTCPISFVIAAEL